MRRFARFLLVLGLVVTAVSAVLAARESDVRLRQLVAMKWEVAGTAGARLKDGTPPDWVQARSPFWVGVALGSALVALGGLTDLGRIVLAVRRPKRKEK